MAASLPRSTPIAGIGGLNAIGGLQATDLNYGLVQRERPELIEEMTTRRTRLRSSSASRQGAGRQRRRSPRRHANSSAKEPPYKDFDYQNQINGELTAELGIAYSFVASAAEAAATIHSTSTTMKKAAQITASRSRP